MATPLRKIPAKKTLGIVIEELLSGFAFSVNILFVFLVIYPVFFTCNAMIVFSSHGEVTGDDVVNILIGLLVTGALCYWSIVAIVFAVFVPISVITRISFDIYQTRN